MTDPAKSKIAQQMEEIALKRIQGDKLVLPVMPAAAVRCLKLLREPDYTTKQVVAVLETDPLLSARIMKLSQSAAFAGGSPPKSLDIAVNRLGAQKVRAALIEHSTRKVFESRDPRIATAFAGLWQHSLAVATLARDLAALGDSGGDPDSAYLCGLLHDVGKPVLASMLLEAERMVQQSIDKLWMDADTWVLAVSTSHRRVGVALAEKWKMPEEIVQGIRDSGDYDVGNRASVVNYVRFANALAKREGIAVGPVDVEDANALVMIGRSLLSINDELLGRVSGGLMDRVRAQME